MSVIIDGKTYYRTAEVFRRLDISRNTLYRWLRKGILSGIEQRDSRGWRLFTQEDIDGLNSAINHITRIERKAPREAEYARKNARNKAALPG
jgi:predicted site-specific integrase-resolvase